MHYPKATAALITTMAIGLFAAGCSDKDDDASTPTATAAASETAQVTPTGGTASPSSTPPSSTTTTPGTTTPPPAEGTIDPLNPGQTGDWQVKANPDPPAETAILVEVRVGVHPEEGGWERIVFEFDGTQLPPAVVGYVSDPAQCGSGQPIDIEGEMVLGVLLRDTQAHDDNGQVTVNVLEFDGPGNTIIEGVQGCDFEGHVDWFLGLKGEQNFKIVTLQNPTRLVVDIKQ